MQSGGRENSKQRGVKNQEDKETVEETGGKNPGVLERVHSESHCCISVQGWEPCGHLGYLKSGITKEKTLSYDM